MHNSNTFGDDDKHELTLLLCNIHNSSLCMFEGQFGSKGEGATAKLWSQAMTEWNSYEAINTSISIYISIPQIHQGSLM